MLLGWGLLLAVIAIEATATLWLKNLALANKMTLGILAVLAGAYVVRELLMWQTLKTLDVSVAYVVWCGLGTVLVVGAGVWLYGETLSWPKMMYIALILAGVAGLYLHKA